MFALAVFDAEHRRLVLARDRFGIKPLFVARSGSQMAFSSEIKGLLTLPWVRQDWDASALGAYLELGYVPTPLTAYAGIEKMPAGTIETWEVEVADRRPLKSAARRYWKPRAERATSLPPIGEVKERLMELLLESVRLRLRSDVPLGAFLSGGVDSSSVVALMKRLGVVDLKTFCIGFDDTEVDESAFAQRVSQQFGTEHYAEKVTGADAAPLLRTILGAFDEPFADSSAIPTFLVSRLAGEHVTVALSGDGGDELFAGYNVYPYLHKYRHVLGLPRWVRRPVSKLASRAIPEGRRGGAFVRRLDFPSGHPSLFVRAATEAGLCGDVLASPFAAFLADGQRDWEVRFAGEATASSAQTIDQENYLCDDILTKVDRCSMLVSLEARVPLLDHVLAEYVNSLPEEYKLGSHGTKLILKSVMAPELPPGFFDRPKMGFGVPLRKWLTGPLAPDVDRLEQLCDVGVFDQVEIRRLQHQLRTAQRDVSQRVWGLLSLAAWMREPGRKVPW
jgi:asparagine synthase (glutamine-hydrolysing)